MQALTSAAAVTAPFVALALAGSPSGREPTVRAEPL